MIDVKRFAPVLFRFSLQFNSQDSPFWNQSTILFDIKNYPKHQTATEIEKVQR